MKKADYYVVKVEFRVEDEHGKIKKQKCSYLVDACSVTEAEARMTKKLTDDGENDFEIKSAVCSPIVDVIA